MKKMNNKGFSLIELIIVIAIMAVLVAVIAPNLTNYIGKSKANADKSNADTLQSTINNALQDFVSDDSMAYAKYTNSAPEANISTVANALTTMQDINTLLTATKTADPNSFLGKLRTSLNKYITNDKIDPKVKADKYWIKITGTYDTGFECIVKSAASNSTYANLWK